MFNIYRNKDAHTPYIHKMNPNPCVRMSSPNTCVNRNRIKTNQKIIF